jgi:hypothetical protein
MRKILYILLVIVLFYEKSFAQGKIQGKVLERTDVPASFATVALLSAKDSTHIKGIIADENGIYVFNYITAGSYLVTVSTMGFKKYFSTLISMEDANIILPDILLQEESQLLKEVVVKGEIPAVEKQLGKLIVNVNSIIFKTANSAIDILNRSPGIMVDKDGVISIKGNTNPKLMIDSKPASEIDVKSLSSTDIEKIEIISNPGAKYEGDSKGIINIILKRNKALGLSGNANIDYELKRYNQYEAGLSLAHKAKKMVVFGRLGYFSYKLVNDFILKRKIDAGVFEQNSSFLLTPHGYNLRLGADYSISLNQTIGIIVRNFEHPYETLNEGLALISETNRKYNIKTLSDIGRVNQGTSINSNYKAFFDKEKKKELTVNFNYSTFKNSGDQTLESKFIFDENKSSRSVLQNVSRFSTEIKNINIDYSDVINENTKLEFGAKHSWINTQNSLSFDTLRNDIFVRDILRSNQFIYNENILGLYGILTQKWGKHKVEAGLRYEGTITKGNSVTLSIINERSYNNLLPSLQYEYNLNDDNSLSFTYASKITRPTFESLNPFTLFIDKYTYIEGNPTLFPEKVNSFELAYNHKNIGYTLSYIRNTDIITQLPQRLTDGNTYKYTMLNIDEGNTISADINLPFSVKEWWKLQNFFQVAFEQYKSNYLSNQFDNRRFSYYLRTTNVFKLSKGVTLDFSFYYQSPNIQSFYRSNAMYELSGGIQKSILKELGSLTLTFSDILYTYRNYNSVVYQNIELEQTQRRNTQGVKISFSYKIGKSNYKYKSKKTGSSEEENRANN